MSPLGGAKVEKSHVTVNVYESVVLTLDLFMYHQGKVVSLQDAG